MIGLLGTTTDARAAVIFMDDFQSDTAGTTTSGGDLDPVIGVGDTGGSWVVRESSAAHTRVISDTVPGNDMAGSDNYVELIRGGGSSSISKLYATGWDGALTLNGVVQLDFSLWRQSAALATIMFADQAPPGSVGGFPDFNPGGTNTVSIFHGLGAGGDTDVAAEQWTSVRIVADMFAQTYTVSLNGGTPTSHNFYDPDGGGAEVNEEHQVQSILFFTGANNAVYYIDNVKIDAIPEPATWVLLTVGAASFGFWRRR
jgi:hypothetical protein